MKRLNSTLYVSYVMVIVTCVCAVAIYAGVSLRGSFLTKLESNIIIQARLASQRLLLIPQDRRSILGD